MAKKQIKIGQKVRFVSFEEVSGYACSVIREVTTGTVVEIYPEHRWFSVEFGDPKQRTSFKFCDVGERVILLG